MYSNENIKNAKELEFAVFCIENVATKLNVTAERVSKAVAENSNILNGYIIPGYEVLHSQGRDYIVNDIIEVIRERGVKI